MDSDKYLLKEYRRQCEEDRRMEEEERSGYIPKVEQLYRFMKDNYVLKAKVGGVELELHPIAFSKDAIEQVQELKDDQDDYKEFLFPRPDEKINNELI